MNNMRDVENRNGKAVMQALKEQNAPLQEFSDKLIGLSMQMNSLQNEINCIKQKNMQDLVAQFNSGPTEAS